MIVRQIFYWGQPVTLCCDAKCEKAWGFQNRPRVQVGTTEDDYYFPADDELDTAPVDPGTYEGGDAKPRTPDARLNRWCARECERSIIVNVGQGVVSPPDLTRRRYNFRLSDPGVPSPSKETP